MSDKEDKLGIIFEYNILIVYELRQEEIIRFEKVLEISYVYENRVEVMCWIKEDQYLLTGGNDQVMRIWRVSDGVLVKSLEAIHMEKIV